MPILPLSSQSYERAGLAKARLVNMYVEKTPEGPTDSVRRGRPGSRFGHLRLVGSPVAVTTGGHDQA